MSSTKNPKRIANIKVTVSETLTAQEWGDRKTALDRLTTACVAMAERNATDDAYTDSELEELVIAAVLFGQQNGGGRGPR